MNNLLFEKLMLLYTIKVSKTNIEFNIKSFKKKNKNCKHNIYSFLFNLLMLVKLKQLYNDNYFYIYHYKQIYNE